MIAKHAQVGKNMGFCVDFYIGRPHKFSIKTEVKNLGLYTRIYGTQLSPTVSSTRNGQFKTKLDILTITKLDLGMYIIKICSFSYTYETLCTIFHNSSKFVMLSNALDQLKFSYMHNRSTIKSLWNGQNEIHINLTVCHLHPALKCSQYL